MTNSPSEARIWAEITDGEPSTVRFETLSETLREAGIANEFRVYEATRENFESVLQAAQAEGVEAFRIGGSLRDVAPTLFTNLPSLILTMKSADALVKDNLGKLWPRNFLAEAFQHMISADCKDLDLSGAAFVIGATPESRAAVAALVRTGFRRVNVTDFDIERGEACVEEFRRSYFNVQFTFTPRNQITQLAGTHSIAVNTFDLAKDETGLSEFFYFNFLKSGGVFIEVPLGPEENPLLREARSIGAQVETGARLAAFDDALWTEACFGKRIDLASFGNALAQRFNSPAESVPVES